MSKLIIQTAAEDVDVDVSVTEQNGSYTIQYKDVAHTIDSMEHVHGVIMGLVEAQKKIDESERNYEILDILIKYGDEFIENMCVRDEDWCHEFEIHGYVGILPVVQVWTRVYVDGDLQKYGIEVECYDESIDVLKEIISQSIYSVYDNAERNI